VGLYKDDRTGFTVGVEKLVEDPSSPGVFTLPENADKLSFEDMRAESTGKKYGHYFKTIDPLLLTMSIYDSITDLTKLDYELN
jgi:hypothetical protein